MYNINHYSGNIRSLRTVQGRLWFEEEKSDLKAEVRRGENVLKGTHKHT